MYPDHPDISNKIDYFNGVYYDPPNTNDAQHGLKTASIAGAQTNNNNCVSSIGWNTHLRLYGIITDISDENYDVSNIASAIYHASRHSDIISISWGTAKYATQQEWCELSCDCNAWHENTLLIYYDYPEIHTEINNAILSGTYIFASSGNKLPLNNADLGNCDPTAVPYTTYPAAYDGVIAVTASGINSEGESESALDDYNYGSFIDLAAPGQDIAVAALSNTYAIGKGTSYSAPMAAALASLIIAFDPNENVEYILKNTSEKIGPWGYPNGWNCHLGYGRINAYHALLACFPETPTGLSLSGSVGQHPTLSWNSNSEYDLDGYLLYQRIGSGNEYVLANVNEDVTSYTDNGITIGNGKFDPIVRYRLSAYDLANNESEKTSYVSTKAGGINKPIISQDDKIVSSEYKLDLVYPNPFNNQIIIKYEIPEISEVECNIYNSLGKAVYFERLKKQIPGTYQLIWPNYNRNQIYSSGVYYIVLRLNQKIFNKKIVYIK